MTPSVNNNDTSLTLKHYSNSNKPPKILFWGSRRGRQKCHEFVYILDQIRTSSLTILFTIIYMRNKCMTRNLNCPRLHKFTIYAQKNLVRKDGKLRRWKRTLMPNRHENSRKKKLHQNDDDGKLTDDDNNFPSASAIRRLKCWNVETCRGSDGTSGPLSCLKAHSHLFQAHSRSATQLSQRQEFNCLRPMTNTTSIKSKRNMKWPQIYSTNLTQYTIIQFNTKVLKYDEKKTHAIEFRSRPTKLPKLTFLQSHNITDNAMF